MLRVDGEDTLTLSLIQRVEPVMLDCCPGAGELGQAVQHHHLLLHTVLLEVQVQLVEETVFHFLEVGYLNLGDKSHHSCEMPSSIPDRQVLRQESPHHWDSLLDTPLQVDQQGEQVPLSCNSLRRLLLPAEELVVQGVVQGQTEPLHQRLLRHQDVHPHPERTSSKDYSSHINNYLQPRSDRICAGSCTLCKLSVTCSQ